MPRVLAVAHHRGGRLSKHTMGPEAGWYTSGQERHTPGPPCYSPVPHAHTWTTLLQPCTTGTHLDHPTTALYHRHTPGPPCYSPVPQTHTWTTMLQPCTTGTHLDHPVQAARHDHVVLWLGQEGLQVGATSGWHGQGCRQGRGRGRGV